MADPERIALYVGDPRSGLEGEVASLGLSLVTSRPDGIAAALSARASSVVVVVIEATQLADRARIDLAKTLQAQRILEPRIVIGDPATRVATLDADLVLPSSVASAELAAHIRHVVDARPRQILVEHRRVLASLPRAGWLVDAAGNVAALNAPAEQLFGVTAAAVLGQPWQRLVSDAIAKAYRWLFTTRRTGHRAEVGVIELKPLAGGRRKIECSASGLWAGPPDAGGVFVGTLIVSIDVTAAHQIDAQLLQGTKLEAMGHLAGGIAHDFNNLLSVIIGGAQLLRHDLGDHPGVEDLREIENAGMRAAQMTKQLLVFSRKQEPETTTFDVPPMIRNTAKMLRRLLGDQIQLELKLADETLGIRADVGQLEQVLVNLAVNARDAMPKGGRLSITADAVELREGKAGLPIGVTAGEWVQIVVEDQGEGMTAETLERVFEPFFTTKSKDHGTGLGLSVVYGIVKRHEGHIDVRSTVGQGTRFRILFRQVDSLASKPATASSVMRAGGERILLVEDDDMVRRYLTRTLESHGYSVLPVPDGNTALTVAASFPSLDLLVADVGLPGLSGPEVCVGLRERFASLPVIYMSGHIDVAQLEEILGEHDTFLAKPVNASRFLASVRESIDRAK